MVCLPQCCCVGEGHRSEIAVGTSSFPAFFVRSAFFFFVVLPCARNPPVLCLCFKMLIFKDIFTGSKLFLSL